MVAEQLYTSLQNEKCEVILDDRDGSLGFKMKDWELIGIPYIIVCGKKAADGIVEFKDRMTGEKNEMTKEEAFEKIALALKSLK